MADAAKDRRFRVGAGVVLVGVLIACCGTPTARAGEKPPNVVFVLTDDLSWDLVRHMPNVRRLQRDGMTFRQFMVSDSLCCSSRATILTGEFPHNTHVLGNTRPEGGYPAFRRHGARWRSIGRSLQRAGYRTALLGKYLNPLPPGSRRPRSRLGRVARLELSVHGLRLPAVGSHPIRAATGSR